MATGIAPGRPRQGRTACCLFLYIFAHAHQQHCICSFNSITLKIYLMPFFLGLFKRPLSACCLKKLPVAKELCPAYLRTNESALHAATCLILPSDLLDGIACLVNCALDSVLRTLSSFLDCLLGLIHLDRDKSNLAPQ